MSDGESGFGEAVTLAGEGDSPAPRATFDRSPLKVLKNLEGKPLQQAMKAIEYIDAGRERERAFLRLCSPKALNLIAENGPEYLTAVSAAAE
jgi:hypothetical protein